MYQISFPQTSNRATWIFTGQITDAATGELLDLSDLSFVFAVEECGTALLLATTDNGKFTSPSTGIFRWEFSETEMATLCSKTYDTGLTMMNADGQTAQLSVGPLPIVDGNVP